VSPSVTGDVRRERPLVNQDNAYFWDGIAQENVLIQRCTGCGELRHPSSPSCPKCRSLSWDAVQADGRGVLYSFVVIHQPAVPGLPSPHVAVLVELEEGVRMAVATDRIPHEELKIGVPVEIGFVRNGDFSFPDCGLVGASGEGKEAS
jgi:uncharacterized protein